MVPAIIIFNSRTDVFFLASSRTVVFFPPTHQKPVAVFFYAAARLALRQVSPPGYDVLRVVIHVVFFSAALSALRQLPPHYYGVLRAIIKAEAAEAAEVP